MFPDAECMICMQQRLFRKFSKLPVRLREREVCVRQSAASLPKHKFCEGAANNQSPHGVLVLPGLDQSRVTAATAAPLTVCTILPQQQASCRAVAYPPPIPWQCTPPGSPAPPPLWHQSRTPLQVSAGAARTDDAELVVCFVGHYEVSNTMVRSSLGFLVCLFF